MELKIMEHHKEHMYYIVFVVFSKNTGLLFVTTILVPVFVLYIFSLYHVFEDVIILFKIPTLFICSGQNPAEADYNLLDTARKVEHYGIRMHAAKVNFLQEYILMIIKMSEKELLLCLILK